MVTHVQIGYLLHSIKPHVLLFRWSVLNTYYILRIFTMHHAYIVLRGSLCNHNEDTIRRRIKKKTLEAELKDGPRG